MSRHRTRSWHTFKFENKKDRRRCIQKRTKNFSHISTKCHVSVLLFSLFSSVTPRSTASRVSPIPFLRHCALPDADAWFERHGIWRRMTDGLPVSFYPIQHLRGDRHRRDAACTARRRNGKKDRWTAFRLRGWPSRCTPLVKLVAHGTLMKLNALTMLSPHSPFSHYWPSGVIRMGSPV